MLMEDIFEKILVLNLDRSPDRWASVTTTLAKHGIKGYERFRAVDGGKLTETDMERVSYLCHSICPKRMLAISLSHMAMWQKIADESVSSALILEDDVEFVENVTERVAEAVRQLPEDWDLLYLGCITACSASSPLFLVSNLFGNARAGRHSPNLFVPAFPTGTHAYAISQAGARKLLGLISRAKFHVDVEMALNSRHLNIFSVYPEVAFQRQSASTSLNTSADMIPLQYVLDQIKIGNATVGYYSSLPFLRLGSHDVTNLTLLYFVLLFFNLPVPVIAMMAADLLLKPTPVTMLQVIIVGVALWKLGGWPPLAPRTLYTA